METDGQRLKRFHADFEKLRHNREKVPLQQLQTKYARSYNTLVAEVIDGADWFFRKYMETLAFPTHPQDTAGNEWLAKQISAITAEERNPGGLVERYRAALVDRLDMDEYENLVWQSYDRRLREAFDPYWQRHCRWVGEPGNRWIYNDIFKKFWLSPCEGYPAGGWINNDYSGWDGRFPPHLKEETA